MHLRFSIRYLARTALVVVTTYLLAGHVASAAIQIQRSPGFVQPNENVLFNDSDPSLPNVGNPVFGLTNRTATVITVESSQGITLEGLGGQADVRETNGAVFGNASIFPQDPTIGFTEFELNVDALTDMVDGLRITVEGVNIGGGQFVEVYDLNAAGQNFFGILATDNMLMKKITFDTLDQMGAPLDNMIQLQQIRVDGMRIVEGHTPEPASGVIWAAVAGVGLLIRRRVSEFRRTTGR